MPPVAPPLRDVTGGVTLGRSLQDSWALPTNPSNRRGLGWGGPATAPGLAPPPHTHPPPRRSGLRDTGMVPGNPVPEGTRFAKGHIPQRDPLPTIIAIAPRVLSSVLPRFQQKIGDPKKLGISKNLGPSSWQAPHPPLPRAAPALWIHTIQQSQWNSGKAGTGLPAPAPLGPAPLGGPGWSLLRDLGWRCHPRSAG